MTTFADAPVESASVNEPGRGRHPVPITVARGDGIGPEIMDATLSILEAAGARLDVDEVEIGQAVYQRGHSSGIEPSA